MEIQLQENLSQQQPNYHKKKESTEIFNINSNNQDNYSQSYQVSTNTDSKEEPRFYDPNKIISLKNVHKTYLLGVEGVTALRGVSVDIKEGEFITILGTSGGGKTTMLNIMGTIDKPTKGDVFICGQKIKSTTDDKFLASLRLTKLGFVFQTFNLIQSLTALENVELPMILRGELSRDTIRERAIDLLTQVGLKERLNHFPNQLSGGEQQRVTISRALSNNPKILLLDEPTGDLDTKSTDYVMKILLDLNIKKGITMVMVTHDVALKNYANRVVRMIDGKVNAIEVIPTEKREENLRLLEEAVQSHTQSQLQKDQQSNGSGVSNHKDLGVRTGVVQQVALKGFVHLNEEIEIQDGQNEGQRQKNGNQQNHQHLQQNGSKTEYRKPGEYPIFQFAKQRKAQEQAIKQFQH
ncbi:ATP-binding ABC transporter (macronuclear) [Tetrahymena thermophila SB210]|uniref:ATP-binding ABC transporter n=1 Tax=Tetrahymena thermophila (strain SB210) TaxID=312017 RepID=I7MIQ7_TETTS|nr:ATP-binding ABC transporter [Tetrahymena thermophila SB210]EAR94163.1 ATP-binding ABC transporter [Tetrahymena thermophila SB210]|eukprot:XP_001014408.1 ATP-binding ABC transporter [Tetrahymena thermophila SB210]